MTTSRARAGSPAPLNGADVALLVEPYGIDGSEFAAWLSGLIAEHHDTLQQIERFGSRDDCRKHVRQLKELMAKVSQLLDPAGEPRRATAHLFAAAHGLGIDWDADSEQMRRLSVRLGLVASVTADKLSEADRAGAKGERRRNSLVVAVGKRVRELAGAERAGARKLSVKAADHLTFELLKAHGILITTSTDGEAIGDTIRRIRQSVHK